MIKVQISESGGKNAVPGIRRRAAKAPADNARRTSETETQTGQDKTPSFRIDSFERSPFHMPTELSGITGIELPKEKLKELSGELKLAEFHHHYIDWEDTEASFSENSEISIEDSQLLNHRVNRIAALYVTSKNRNNLSESLSPYISDFQIPFLLKSPTFLPKSLDKFFEKCGALRPCL